MILACRNKAKAAEAKAEIRRATSSGHLVIRQLDLSSLASIRAFAEKIKEEESRLDVLINNAGQFSHTFSKNASLRSTTLFFSVSLT